MSQRESSFHENISLFINFSAAPQSSADSDIATAFQRRFHISVDESEQNNVSCAIKFSTFTD